MFQKPAFGANTSGFGMQSTFGSPASSTTSPFGGFKPTTGTSAFGAPPAFGAGTSTQPATGGGLFGATNTTNSLFGSSSTTTPAPAFGASTSFGFGATQPSGGLFSNNTSTGLFGQQNNTTAFGAKPAGFGFGGTTTNTNTGGGLFGNTSTTGGGLFGQQNNTLVGGGGLFSNTTGGFGQQQQATGTAHVKYNPVVGTDVVVKSGTSQNINIKHHCITCMKEYEGKSLDELRLEDYTAGRKGSTSGVFGFQQQETKPLFGTTTGFGQPATTSAPSVFGGGGLTTGGFGQTNTFSFGNNTQTNTNTTGGLFGAAKPTGFGTTSTTGTGLFGAPATTQAPTFGTSTSSFGFGSNLQNQTTGGGLFGAKPATSVFGSAPASTGFGSFGSGGGFFSAKPLQTQAPTFGPTTGMNTLAGGFGTNTSTSGGLFGGNTAFGKPTTTQPTFGFGNAQPSLGLGGGLNNSFAQKPAATGFGTLGGGTMFQQPATNNTFRTGLDSGLGGGMFGNTSTLGNASLGLGMNANNSALVNSSLSGFSAAGNVHEQILTLAARPYGDSPLFKDLLPDSTTTAEDVLKPTNPSAVSAVLERSAYRVSPNTTTRLQLRSNTHSHTDKKSLFDGLEESDASLEHKLSLKPSRKRLVLRKKSDVNNDSIENSAVNYRSQEEPSRPEINGDEQTDKENLQRNPETERAKRNLDFPDGNHLDESNDRQGSWLSSSKLPWNDKEKSLDGDTPRLYPNLDKELSNENTERRASWLTTKPLRKPLVPNPESAENSVRELGVRSPTNTSHDKENVDTLSVCEDEVVAPRDSPPHPTGVKLTRPGYYTIPSLDDMINYMRPDGSCVVPHLTIGRTNYGNVYYDTEIDVAGLDLDALVHFLNKEVIVYPEDADKPPVGSGLNRRAIVTLDRIWPRDKTERKPITDPDRLLKMDYEGKLRRVCDKHDTKFIEYRPQTGSWVFRVEHFSKYGLTDSDEEDDPTPDVMKRQLLQQTLQKNAAPLSKSPLVGNSGGLGGLGLSGGGLITTEDSIYAMQQTSLNLLNGASKAFEMDTTEDNTESQSLYQDNRAYGVKSPTSELARLENRQSHHVQLMKASLYTDTEVDDNMSVSTGDQLVPMSAPLMTMTESLPTLANIEYDSMEVSPPQITEEPRMKPLIIKPHTIVLRYHRKVMPFKKTTAGRLDASCIADMNVCRARHSRVGFGAGSALVYTTTYDSVAELPKNAELCDLDNYVRGRTDDDWSEPIVARLALSQPEKSYNIADILSKHLDTLFKYSTLEKSNISHDICPKLVLSHNPKDRHEALLKIMADSATDNNDNKFGVTGAYCYEIYKLCEALWGADLENDGVPGTDNLSIVNRHRKFLNWITESVAAITENELKKPVPAEDEDESDKHSARIWTLLIGGRVLEACRVARENGHMNMATLIAQASGDPTFRSLVQRQLSLWRECGADKLMSSNKLSSLSVIAGSTPTEQLCALDWRRALHVTARYLCNQVPTLEQIIRKYEGFFAKSDDELDLTTLTDDVMGMKFPLPPYMEDYDVLYNGGQKRRVLDLRYELIRARAFNSRPKITPPHYTQDPMDYSLSFVLGVWFGNIDVCTVSGVAEQLEAAGYWHRAIQALTYMPHDANRTHLIRSILSRHAPAKLDTTELQTRMNLLKTLNIPEKWICLAQAYRAKYEHLPSLEAEYLVGAGQWNAAHKVLLDELLPEAVLSDNLQSISPLLEKMSEAARRDEVSGWESGGQALYHYLHVCDEIRGVVSGEDVSARLEALRPAVAAAATATGNMKTNSGRGLAARAEMGSRLVQLAVCAGANSQHLAGLIRALKLPPDCTAHAMYKITSELAEQASELCIESANSSPISSHHRATAAS